MIYAGTHLFTPLEPAHQDIGKRLRRAYKRFFKEMCIDCGYPEDARPGQVYRMPPKQKKRES